MRFRNDTKVYYFGNAKEGKTYLVNTAKKPLLPAINRCLTSLYH